MSMLRTAFARSVVSRQGFRLARRMYASEAAPAGAGDKNQLTLSLVLPHETIYKASGVTQVNIAAVSGDMGILSNHVASIEALRPGVIEVIEGGETIKWFASGGFANIHPNNELTINAVEAFPLDQFSPEAARSGLAEAQRVASGPGSEADKAEAAVEVEVYEALLAALK